MQIVIVAEFIFGRESADAIKLAVMRNEGQTLQMRAACSPLPVAAVGRVELIERVGLFLEAIDMGVTRVATISIDRISDDGSAEACDRRGNIGIAGGVFQRAKRLSGDNL